MKDDRARYGGRGHFFMRNFSRITIFFALALSLVSRPLPIWALSSNAGPINVSADVPTVVSLNMTILDRLTGTEVSSLDFGELPRVGDELRSAKAYEVQLEVNTSGSPYTLTQVSTPLVRSGGSEAIPAQAFFARPFYDAASNSDAVARSSARIGSAGPAMGSRPLFSDPTGTARTISVYYTLSGDPSTGATSKIPLNQRSGSYSGTVQFTLTTA